MRYHSQYGQDQYIHENFFSGTENGFFIEFGALDGRLDSNTLFFEEALNWTGLLIEPNPEAFGLLETNRPRCRHENIAISDRNGVMPFLKIDGGFYGWSGLRDGIEPQHRERIEQYVQASQLQTIDVPVHDLAWLADSHDLSHVDLMSIDTEGTEERIMRAFPWERIRVSVFCIENNFANYDIDDLMRGQGYEKHGRIGTDDIYVHPRHLAARGHL